MFEVIRCLRSFFAFLSVFVCRDDDTCRVICLFFRQVYLAQSYRGISTEIFVYILHTSIRLSVAKKSQRAQSQTLIDSKNGKKL